MMCHQANDFQVTEQEWQRLRREIDRFHADGRCVIFVGYEWSGMTPGGGDRNVMYRGDVASLHRSSHAEVDDMGDAATDCFPVTELFDQLRGRDDVMLIPHIGGRYADIVGFHEPALEPWSRSTPTGAVRVAPRGRPPPRLPGGFVANSDGHKGRPGASHPGASRSGPMAASPACCRRRSHGSDLRCHQGAALLCRDRGPAHPRRAGRHGLPWDRKGGPCPVPIGGRVVGTGRSSGLSVPRARDRSDGLAVHARILRGITPLPNRLGGLTRAGRDRLTTWDGTSSCPRPHRRCGDVRDGEPREGHRRADDARVRSRLNTTGDDDGST